MACRANLAHRALPSGPLPVGLGMIPAPDQELWSSHCVQHSSECLHSLHVEAAPGLWGCTAEPCSNSSRAMQHSSHYVQHGCSRAVLQSAATPPLQDASVHGAHSGPQTSPLPIIQPWRLDEFYTPALSILHIHLEKTSKWMSMDF